VAKDHGKQIELQSNVNESYEDGQRIAMIRVAEKARVGIASTTLVGKRMVI
jgi:hypothetical protein